MLRVSFVCLGNICRSPTAEGVMRALVEEAGLADRIGVESAGTGAWHVGELPDPRSAETAARRGVQLESRARQFEAADFERLALVLAMDGENLAELEALAPHAEARAKLQLLRSFDPAADQPDVPDPYYGGARGFDDVFEICERSCTALLASLRHHYGL